ncbi:MAG TPA: hypothetical protein VKB19_17655 [Pedobacter sp.]|nr:hypothetical protein [Pedobacter sp.]
MRHQIMRPIILIQLVFAGFMCSTSIFYFLDHLGYTYFQRTNGSSFLVNEQTYSIAECQRLALLAHTAISTGLILLIKPLPHLKYFIRLKKIPFLVNNCIIAYVVAMSLTFIPGLIQFKQPLINISITCSAYLLITGIVERNHLSLLFGSAAFTANITNSILSGYKEAVILNIILLVFLAYPYYKRIVLIMALPTIYLLLYALPTFTNIIRMQSWTQKKTKTQAGTQAYQTLFQEQHEKEIITTNWEFLTDRFSEIGMFTSYVKQASDDQFYDETSIIKNTILSLIPRILWPEKPNTEKIAMERVYKFGIANRASPVSAKTRPVVDAYLIAGPAGVFIMMLTYGLVVQSICNRAEMLFGGYQYGCIVIFNSLFQVLWRGNTLEFLVNNIMYSYILMVIIHWFLRKTKVLIPVAVS